MLQGIKSRLSALRSHTNAKHIFVVLAMLVTGLWSCVGTAWYYNNRAARNRSAIAASAAKLAKATERSANLEVALKDARASFQKIIKQLEASQSQEAKNKRKIDELERRNNTVALDLGVNQEENKRLEKEAKSLRGDINKLEEQKKDLADRNNEVRAKLTALIDRVAATIPLLDDDSAALAGFQKVPAAQKTAAAKTKAAADLAHYQGLNSSYTVAKNLLQELLPAWMPDEITRVKALPVYPALGPEMLK